MNTTPNPLPEHVMIVDDDGTPRAMIDLDKIQADSIALAFDMARVCGDPDALDAVSGKWLDTVDPETFGYLCTGALRVLAHNILDPTLQVLDAVAPNTGMRARLTTIADEHGSPIE